MKTSLKLAIIFFIALAFVGCNEIEKLKARFIPQAHFVGLAAYKDKIFYIAVQTQNNENVIYIGKWNAFDYHNIEYIVDLSNDTLGEQKYIKSEGPQIPKYWDEGRGIKIVRNEFFWSYKEIPRRKWMKEVKEIITVLLEKPRGILETQRLLAIDLGYIGKTT